MFAYEVSLMDVFQVLEAHGLADSEEEEIVFDAYGAIQEVADQITEAVLEHGDPQLRRAVALQEIEAILIDEGLLDEPERFTISE